LELQRAPLAPIRLRIGIHTGEIQLRDEGNYAGPTINRNRATCATWATAAKPCSPAPPKRSCSMGFPTTCGCPIWARTRYVTSPRPERVMQLCHPDLVNDFPPLRVAKAVISQRLPVQLTSFVGRDEQLGQVHELLTQNRLVTLTGAGGSGKTRLAIQIAGQLSGEFGDGIWYVDLGADHRSRCHPDRGVPRTRAT